MRKSTKVHDAEVGIGTGIVVHRNQLMGMASQPVMAKIVVAVGTTCTVALEGSRDGGVTWVVIQTATYTLADTYYQHSKLATQPRVRYHQWRLNISVNTGCTITGYIGKGSVED